MKDFTEEYILLLLDKHRDFFIENLEKSICLECCNTARKLELTTNGVEFREDTCKMCGKIKSCIKF